MTKQDWTYEDGELGFDSVKAQRDEALDLIREGFLPMNHKQTVAWVDKLGALVGLTLSQPDALEE